MYSVCFVFEGVFKEAFGIKCLSTSIKYYGYFIQIKVNMAMAIMCVPNVIEMVQIDLDWITFNISL